MPPPSSVTAPDEGNPPSARPPTPSKPTAPPTIQPIQTTSIIPQTERSQNTSQSSSEDKTNTVTQSSDTTHIITTSSGNDLITDDVSRSRESTATGPPTTTGPSAATNSTVSQTTRATVLVKSTVPPTVATSTLASISEQTDITVTASYTNTGSGITSATSGEEIIGTTLKDQQPAATTLDLGRSSPRATDKSTVSDGTPITTHQPIPTITRRPEHGVTTSLSSDIATSTAESALETETHTLPDSSTIQPGTTASFSPQPPSSSFPPAHTTSTHNSQPAVQTTKLTQPTTPGHQDTNTEIVEQTTQTDSTTDTTPTIDATTTTGNCCLYVY